MAEKPENPHASGVAELLEDVRNRGEMLNVGQLPVQILRVRPLSVLMRQMKKNPLLRSPLSVLEISLAVLGRQP